MKAFVALKIRALRPAANLGPVPSLLWVRVADLRLDPTYQREITPRGLDTIARITECFDWRKFKPIVVASAEGETYAVVDGQHRVHAALLVGIDTLPAYRIDASAAEQAEAFAAVNGCITAIRPIDLFKARLAAGDKHAVAVAALAQAEGVELLFTNRATNLMAPRQSVAVHAIMRMRHGDAIVSLALAAVLACKPHQGSNLSALWIKAFCRALADHKEWCDREALRRWCADFDPWKVQAANQKRRERQQSALRSDDLAEASLLEHFAAKAKGDAA
ncbi:ParB N-terminal domain-containing protein [Methylovirgula sp. HY1]|uniref:ParB N-terminal domain-containing protein n=1 Tax=Methylovirgula sp. HY1 TaxID=2822761 RepID=UPI001C5AEE43|nr:ParB N-terminal domain-containing protein [Methylovirgula sp. HY1]QXX74259.1 hypothetical protein MHY1_01069 [Methylovirgula sp. HY1]